MSHKVWLHVIEREGHPLVAVQLWFVPVEGVREPRGELLVDREVLEVLSSVLPALIGLLGDYEVIWTGWRPEAQPIPGLASGLKMLRKVGGLRKLLSPGASDGA